MLENTSSKGESGVNSGPSGRSREAEAAILMSDVDDVGVVF